MTVMHEAKQGVGGLEVSVAGNDLGVSSSVNPGTRVP
jgi:hypothetical protein